MTTSNIERGEVYFTDVSNIASINRERCAIYVNEASNVASQRDQGNEGNSTDDDVYLTSSTIPARVETSTTTNDIISSSVEIRRPRNNIDEYDEDHYALARQSGNVPRSQTERQFGIKGHHVAIFIVVIIIVAAAIAGAIFGFKHTSNVNENDNIDTKTSDNDGNYSFSPVVEELFVPMI